MTAAKAIIAAEVKALLILSLISEKTGSF